MGQGTGWDGPGPDASGRRADRRADEARLGPLLERTYAAGEARLTLADDALARLNAAIDAIGAPPRRRADHRRLFGACALAMLLLMLLVPIAHAEFTASTRHAGRSTATANNGAVGGGAITGTARDGTAMLPVTVAAREAGSVVPTEVDDATGRAPAPNAATLAAGPSETPLRDLLARAGIRASDLPGGSTTEGRPPQR